MRLLLLLLVYAVAAKQQPSDKDICRGKSRKDASPDHLFSAGDDTSVQPSSTSTATNFVSKLGNNTEQIIPPQSQLLLQEQAPPIVQHIPPQTGSFCFSEDTWVTTPTGKKNMAMLEIGDRVLTANLTHKFYAPVTVWMHRDPEKYAHFYTIMTEYGKMLRITAKHLIFRNKCGDHFKEYIKELPKNEEAVFAHELVKDDCVILLYSGKWRLQKIKEITRTKRKGIYAPLTANGRILVNDILASCYSDAKEPTLQTTYYQAISLMRETYWGLTGWFVEKKITLPFSTDMLKDVWNIILPN